MDWKKFGLGFLERYAADIIVGVLSRSLRQYPLDRLNQWLVRFGKAFGPANLRHFSELTDEEKFALLDRVPVLRGNHTDWIKPFQWVPRTITTWVGPKPELADVIDGVVTELKPLPHPGEWYVLRGYMASTTEEGIHNRLGWRYDDVDDYFTLSISVKVK